MDRSGILSDLYRAFDHFVPSDDRVTQVVVLAAVMFAIRMVSELTRMFQTMLNIRIGYSGLMGAIVWKRRIVDRLPDGRGSATYLGRL